MLKKRLVACLLVREGLIVQSYGFSRWLPIGRPRFPIEFVSRWDVDEIVLLDMSASPEERPPDPTLLTYLSQYCYIPLTVGGGIGSVEAVRQVIRSGADKISLNTAALTRPAVITDIADAFGSQCVVVSIDCRAKHDGRYEVFANSGQTPTGLEPRDWAARCQTLGAGEIFLKSIDRDGSRQGYDLKLIRSVTAEVDVPVIACGGVGRFDHFAPGILEGGASAVAAGNIFHHSEHSTILAKAHLRAAGIEVRLDSEAQYVGRTFDGNGRLVMLSPTQLANIELENQIGAGV